MKFKTLFQLLSLALLLALSIFVTGCSNSSAAVDVSQLQTPGEYYLGGKHELRKFNDDTKVTHHEGGWWFILIGGSGKKDVVDAKIAIWWKMNDGTYGLSRIALEDLRIKLDETATTPYLEFAQRYNHDEFFKDHDLKDYTPDANPGATADDLIRIYANHVILTVRPEDWPIELHLPQN